MGQASASSSASSGINNAGGGNITKNSPGIWIAAIAAIVLVIFIIKRKA
ncbi:MAG TPA: hypothetical protein VEH04_11385 [Verrucomicrobiae bacterium]|nr:hypothetical protein [Verrucomicrobiae bacterium]